MHIRYLLAAALMLALGLIVVVSVPPSTFQLDPATAKKLQELRNLGKAMYENPGTQTQAVDVLRQAAELNPNSAQDRLNYGLSMLRAGQADEGIVEIERARELNPNLPHTYFNLGIEFKKRNEVERAVRELEHMARLVPDEPKTHYNLGVLYKLQDDLDRAVASFEHTIKLGPNLAAPHFQLYNTLRRTDRERAREHLDRFREIKELTEGAAVGEDVNWSFYSELHDPPAPAPPAREAKEIRFQAAGDGAELGAAPRGMLLLPADAENPPHVVAWSEQGLLLDALGNEPVTVSIAGLRQAAAGDMNNDGRSDLCLAGSAGASLLTETEHDSPAFGQPQTLAAGDFNACLWVDYDHDYDLDLLAVGSDQVLLRNNGDGTFADVSDSFPFAEGVALGATWLELWENNSFNIVVAYSDKVVVYEDRKLGLFRPETVPGATPGEGPLTLEVIDADHDGFLDVAMTGAAGTRFLRNVDGRLRAGATLPTAAAWADWSNRGSLDAVSPSGMLHNLGRFEFELAETAGLPENLAFAAAADFNADGRPDLAAIDGSGKLHYLTNETDAGNNWVTLGFHGVKNNILTEGARIEVKAGRIFRKAVYAGYPLTFGLGGAERIDTVRITWPNGLIQNESEQAVNQAHNFEEKPRLSGSCPMVYTWNGEEFEFISEVLGVAPLGAGAGGGQFFSVDHDEYVWIRGERLKPRGGFYNVRITEELREVAYLDQIKLLAVDHPAEVDVFTSEKFKGPPFPEFQVYEVRERTYPVAAVDEHGHDVLDRVTKLDRRYVDDFRRNLANLAEHHSLTLDFSGAKGDLVLFLHGWVDWADASRIVAGSQSKSNNLHMPVLEVKDRQGRWVTADPDMGLPAGGPRTIALDLSGKFLSDSREVRISSNMVVYWDEAFVAPKQTARRDKGQTRLTELQPTSAVMDFRGFSQVVLHPSRRQPESYIYASVSPTTLWNPTPGNYTRYGDVRELLTTIDDRFAILGAGDEIDLRFAADRLPELPAGWRRDFLLMVDGWAKENEANTAFGDSVDPLPFHTMSGYPYGPGEGYPDSERHRAYLREYNVRPALRLIRPLVER